jgi:hypothetical protein
MTAHTLGSRTIRLADLTPSMVGTKDAPKLKVKAIECYWLCRFLLDAVRKFRVHIPGRYQVLHDSGSALRDYVELLTSVPMNLSLTQLQFVICFGITGHPSHPIQIWDNFMAPPSPHII